MSCYECRCALDQSPYHYVEIFLDTERARRYCGCCGWRRYEDLSQPLHRIALVNSATGKWIECFDAIRQQIYG